MFSFIKEVFIVLFSFSSSLATKCLSLKDDPCMIKPALIDLNPVDKCRGSCNVLSSKVFDQKYLFQKKQKT